MRQLIVGKQYYAVVSLFFILMGLYIKDELIHITMLGMSTSEVGYSRYYIVGMMAIGMYIFLQMNSNREFSVKLPKAGRVFIVFILITYFLSLLLSIHSSFSLLSDYFARLLPIFALYIAYKFFVNIKEVEKVLFLFFLYAIFLGYYYVTFSMQKLLLLTSEDTINSSVYFLLYLLPILACTKHKYLKYPTIAVIGFFVVMSAKRGSFVAFILGLAVYIIVGSALANKMKFIHILLAVSLLVCLTLGITYLQEDESLFLFSRMEGVGVTSYGSRGDLYPVVIKMILSSDLFSMLIGHGYNSVILDSNTGFSAHNDFLEIWYDFGLLGLALYLALWYHIVKVGVSMVRNKSVYAAPYFMMLTILFVTSMVSQIYLYNQYLLMFSVSLGLIWGLYRRDQIIVAHKLHR